MMVTAFPKASGPVPVVISQTFADTCSVFPDEPVTNAEGQVCDGGMMEGFPGWAATQIFGTYIALAPVERYFDAGLAYASFYASDFIPDRKKEAPEAMAALGGPVNPTSALMAWAPVRLCRGLAVALSYRRTAGPDGQGLSALVGARGTGLDRPPGRDSGGPA